jgi:VWFA-related protein
MLIALVLAVGTTVGVRSQPAVASPDAAAQALPGAVPAVRIDAVVTDRQGRPIRDLRPSDFHVRVNGAVQAITADDARRARPSRVFAFLLDEFHVAPGAASDDVRNAVVRFIDRQMRPGDRAVVVKPLDPLTDLRFTDDREALRAAAGSFAGRKGDLLPRTRFEEDFIGRAPAAVAAARAQIVTVALSEIAVQLGDAAAERTAVVLVSDGFARPAPTRRSPRVPDLQGVARAASRHAFAVYGLSPARAAGDGADADAEGARTIDWLAAQTGGLAPRPGTPLAEGLARMADDLDDAYALTLVAPATDGRFHSVEVTTTRAGTAVRTKPGYWAPLSAEWRASVTRASAPPAPPRMLKRSPLIEAWVGLRPRAEGGADVLVAWRAAAALAGRRNPPAAVMLVARTGGAEVFRGAVARAGGDATAVTGFAAPAGRLEVDFEVRGTDGALLDTETRDVVVPEGSRAGPLILEPEIVRTRSLPEFRDVSGNPRAVPTRARSFSRGDRLLVRVPYWAGRAGTAVVQLRVLNRGGQPIRAVEPLPTNDLSVAVFDLPLAWLAPGHYYLELTATSAQGAVRENVAIRITG